MLDSSFSSWMIKSWGSDPGTGFKQVTKGFYLVEFVSVDEKNKVHSGGPWGFRGDIVATRLVSSHLDLSPDRFEYVDLWVHFYNVPINAVNEEGLDMIGEEVGTPVSLPIEGFSGGRKFIKMKIKVDIREPLKDKAKFTHQTIGDFQVHFFYERVSHICRFCGKLGHNMAMCPDHGRLMELASSPAYKDRVCRKDIMEPRKGAWMMDSSVIPKESGGISNIGLKRGLEPSGQQGKHQANDILESSSSTGLGLANSMQNRSFSPSLKRPRPAGLNAPVVDI